MKLILQKKSVPIIGIEIKTTNSGEQSNLDIPQLWMKFYQESILDQIPQKVSGDIYALYTSFENEGQNTDGLYSFIIGAEVKPSAKAPKGFVFAKIPVSHLSGLSGPGGKTRKNSRYLAKSMEP